MYAGEWSKAVIARDQKCMQCGSTERLTARHVVAGYRYDPDNGEAVCMRCRWKSEASKRPKIKPEPIAKPVKPKLAVPIARPEKAEEPTSKSLPPRSLFKQRVA